MPSCGPILSIPSWGLNVSREAAKGRRKEAEVCPLLECFSDRSSRRMGSADCADSHRLVPGGSIGESASNPKSADEMDWELAKLLRMRLIFLAIGSGGPDGSCTRQGSRTTGRAVFRIRRLNPAAYATAKSDGVHSPYDRTSSISLSFNTSPLFARPGGPLAACCLCPSGNPPGPSLTARPDSLPLAAASVCFRPLRADPAGGHSGCYRFFGPSLHTRYGVSTLLRPLLTSATLSRGRSPQVRCQYFRPVPPDST